MLIKCKGEFEPTSGGRVEEQLEEQEEKQRVLVYIYIYIYIYNIESYLLSSFLPSRFSLPPDGRNRFLLLFDILSGGPFIVNVIQIGFKAITN